MTIFYLLLWTINGQPYSRQSHGAALPSNAAWRCTVETVEVRDDIYLTIK